MKGKGTAKWSKSQRPKAESLKPKTVNGQPSTVNPACLQAGFNSQRCET
jgi:hypothetical protein